MNDASRRISTPIQSMDNSRPETLLDTDKPHTPSGMAGDTGGASAVDDAKERGIRGIVATSCPVWCGAAIDGVVEYCCPSCREICEGFSA